MRKKLGFRSSMKVIRNLAGYFIISPCCIRPICIENIFYILKSAIAIANGLKSKKNKETLEKNSEKVKRKPRETQ